MPDHSKITQKNAKEQFEMTQRPAIAREEANRLGKELVWQVDFPNCDMPAILELIAKGANVDCIDNGVKALTAAAYQGHLDVVKALIDAEADPNCSAEGHPTPLIAALKKKNFRMMKLLLDLGAVPSMTEMYKRETPLHWAITENFPEGARLLLDRNADIRAIGDTGLTPLRHAKRLGRQVFIDMLEAEPARRAEAQEAQKLADNAVRAVRITSVAENTVITAPRLKVGGKEAKP